MNPTPTVPLGGQESFWCETQNESGHKYRRLLTYMNEYEMGLADDCDSAPLDNVRYDEEKDTWYWTGWFEPSCEQCEIHWTFHDKVLRWLPLPRFDAPAQHPDTVRLNWLESEDMKLVCNTSRYWFEYPDGASSCVSHDSVRAAIDAAKETSK